MQTKTLIAHPLPHPCLLPNPNRSTSLSLSPFSFTPPLPNLRSSAPIRRRNTLFTACLLENLDCDPGGDGDGNDAALVKADELENRSIWDQMKEIAMFTGPATGLWLCGPLMSLIDTVVIGQGSTIELAALGPGTVMCDYMSYVFMFLSIATLNMVATSLARQLLLDQRMQRLLLQQILMFRYEVWHGRHSLWVGLLRVQVTARERMFDTFKVAGRWCCATMKEKIRREDTAVRGGGVAGIPSSGHHSQSCLSSLEALLLYNKPSKGFNLF